MVNVILVLRVACLFSSRESSPMLSMLLSVEGDNDPCCCAWSPIAMHSEIIFMLLHLCCLNCPSTSSLCRLTMHPIILRVVITSFLVVLPCCIIFHEFFIYILIRICTELLLHCKVLEIIFPMSHHSPKANSEQESYARFTPALQSVPKFQNM